MSQSTTQTDRVRGRAVVVQPEDGPSYWQPVPANGHADPKLYPARTGFAGHAMGFQTIAPGSRVREHSHGDQVELQICFRGQGHVLADGVRHPLVPGTACLLGYDVKHELVNDGPDDLVMLWVITPPGLEDFFKAGGGRYLDVFSFHIYNGINGDLFLARKTMDTLQATLARHGLEKIEKWQTEQGFFAAVYGSYQPRLQARWTMLRTSSAERCSTAQPRYCTFT